jgi:hypothetical protein
MQRGQDESNRSASRTRLVHDGRTLDLQATSSGGAGTVECRHRAMSPLHASAKPPLWKTPCVRQGIPSRLCAFPVTKCVTRKSQSAHRKRPVVTGKLGGWRMTPRPSRAGVRPPSSTCTEQVSPSGRRSRPTRCECSGGARGPTRSFAAGGRSPLSAQRARRSRVPKRGQ